ncbi:MAG: hypothetical protein U0325_32045 [Polyangiales bacterium]
MCFKIRSMTARSSITAMLALRDARPEGVAELHRLRTGRRANTDLTRRRTRPLHRRRRRRDDGTATRRRMDATTSGGDTAGRLHATSSDADVRRGDVEAARDVGEAGTSVAVAISGSERPRDGRPARAVPATRMKSMERPWWR